jgi:hypothetical protein
MLISILDFLRIAIVCVAFFFGYRIGFSGGYDPFAQLHFMIPMVIVALAGISGLEGLFFGKESAEAKGYETGSNYQRQSSIALLSYAVTSVFIYFMNWGIRAELSVFFPFMFFFILSAVNHAANAILHKNFKWQNINRPFLVLLLIGGMIYPVAEALKRM